MRTLCIYMNDQTTQATPSRADIERLVDGFYTAVRADALLGPVFERHLHGRWHTHLPRMVEFWCTVLLKTHSFRGDVYSAHMGIDGIAEAHVQRWLELWHEHTGAAFDADAAWRLQATAQGIARTLRIGWFGREAAGVRVLEHAQAHG